MRADLLLALIGVTGAMALAGCGAASPRFTSEPERKTPSPSEPVLTFPAFHLLAGVASYYAEEFNGRSTADGETYDMNALTAAHPTLPFNTILRVTNLENNRSVVVRVNDRGPFKKDRVIDLSLAAAKALGLVANGTAPVKLDVLKMGTP